MRRAAHGRGGFTVIELVFSIAVIFLLMGLLIAGIRWAVGGSKATADRAAVNGLKTGVSQFKQTFNILPPLVKDAGRPGNPDPIFTSGPASRAGQPVVYSVSDPMDLEDLRSGTIQGEPGTTSVYSIYSLAYYLMGALETDGVPGPGFRAVQRDGSFEKTGRTFQPFFDARRGGSVFEDSPPGTGRVSLRDSNNIPYRYYRWVADDGQPNPNHPAANPAIGLDGVKIYLNVPRILYDPAFYLPFSQLSSVGAVSPPLPPELRSAEYAILGAGPNGLFGDEPVDEIQRRLGVSFTPGSPDEHRAREQAWSDNIMEAGR